MIKIINFLMKNKNWITYLLTGLVLYFSFIKIWKMAAFAHPNVKALVISSEKCDSLVRVQDMQLTVFNDEVNGYYLQIINDSIRHYKDIATHQINSKELLRRNRALEGIMSQYVSQGPCRYKEDSLAGNWPNRQKFIVWKTRPCDN
jgi:hypothetical protein